MPRSRRSPGYRLVARRVGAVIGVVAMVAGCSSRVDGHPVGAPSSVTDTSRNATSATGSATAPASPTSAPTSGNAPAGSFLCPGTSPAAIAPCLEASLGEVWSGLLNQAISQPVVLAPAPTQVPAACRAGLDLGIAFTCRTDGKLYVTAQFLTLITATFLGTDLGYALAALQAHEMGHVVQLAVRQPGSELPHPTAAQSKVTEQQADCLGAVWASHVTNDGGMNLAHYESVNYQLIVLISSNAEIFTHGTPPERRAAVDLGLSGRPQACKLATFH